VKVFLSHASEQADVARGIEIALRGEGHSVFLDRSVLQPGETYNDQIRDAIAQSDLFVFLISPEALGGGRYTLTEVQLAEERWPRAAGHLLPVMVKPTDLRAVPAYLRGVTILEPRGDIAAAVAAAVARLSRPWWWRLIRRSAAILVLGALVAMSAGAWWGYQRWLTATEVSSLLATGGAQHRSGNYAGAWDTCARAAVLAPRRRDVALAQEQVAMDWLDNIRVTVGHGTFTDIVDKVQFVLARCAASAEARRAADCLAHQGWGDFLRTREGAGGLDPTQYYRRALQADPDNVYAHTMWGFDILRAGGAPAEARAHFAQALAAGRARAYVRRLQIAAWLWRREPEFELEAVRVANDMRANGEAMSPGDSDGSDARRLWDIYRDRLVNGRQTEAFLAALSGSDQIATFRWLFPESRIPADKRNVSLFMLAVLQERAGEPAAALTTYRTLYDSMAREGALGQGGPLPARTVEAIGRLSKGR
jgi:TIR domain